VIDSTVRPCVFCAEPNRPDAALCWRCGRPALLGCRRLARIGAQLHLGETDRGDHGLWAAVGGGPVATYPPTPQGGYEAQLHFDSWESPAAAQRDRSGWIALVVVFVVVAVVYIAYHASRYQHCVVSPGLFAWPDRCL
jgi:hypothetical protein